MGPDKGFYWQRHPKVEKFFLKTLAALRKDNQLIARLEEKIFTHTSSRILDWTDHIVMADTVQLRSELAALGFQLQTDEAATFFFHPGVCLPRVLLFGPDDDIPTGLALAVEEIPAFLQANSLSAEIEGSPYSPYRRALVNVEKGISLYVVERRGTWTFAPVYKDDSYIGDYLTATEMWKKLPRSGNDREKALDMVLRRMNDIKALLGQDLAAHVICSCERDYWLSRNLAARMQKSRHDTLGLGWANHDHHTFRSSRKNFRKIISLFSQLGFHKRERFFAGREAGWGAQVMENPTAGLTLFLDVDLTDAEVDIDFTGHDLDEREKLGTVGLWCALHGDSILKAGMHHLAARYSFVDMIGDISAYNIDFMAPFSDFSYLKQAFSVAERWPVDDRQLNSLLAEKRITAAQAETFAAKGAVGSHLENIQRREGYKGFNKKNVSAIISTIDPRKHDR